MSGQKAEHIVFNSGAQTMLCKSCEDFERLEMPIPINAACILIAAFVKQHMDCQPTGLIVRVEAMTDQSTTEWPGFEYHPQYNRFIGVVQLARMPYEHARVCVNGWTELAVEYDRKKQQVYELQQANTELLADNDKMKRLLLLTLYYHQCGSSPVGQPIRGFLGIGQFDGMTDEQLAIAKAEVKKSRCERCGGSALLMNAIGDVLGPCDVCNPGPRRQA